MVDGLVGETTPPNEAGESGTRTFLVAGPETHPRCCVSAGGMVLNPAYFGTVSHQNTMIHEMGHILGLYHVFKGVSERESCEDPCQVSLTASADAAHSTLLP